MSFLDFLSPALTTATQAAGTYQGAQAQAAQDKQKAIVQQLLLQRQQHEQAIKDALMQAQTGEATARTGDLQAQGQLRQYQFEHPKPTWSQPIIGPHGEVQIFDQSDPAHTVQTLPGIQGKPPEPVIGSPEWVKAEIKKAQINNQYGYHPPQMVYEPTPITDPTNPNAPPQVGRFDRRTGTITPTGFGKPVAAGGANGTAVRSQVQVETAAGQAALADQGMRAYEDKVLSGQANLNPLAMHLARAAIGGSTTAEATLNTLNPELASYVRFAKQVATAERMISPRGGSSAMTNAEALLSGAGASGTPAQIQNAREYRAALIHGLQSHSGAPQAHPSTASHAQQLWDAAVAKYGQEKVLQEYGPRPTQ